MSVRIGVIGLKFGYHHVQTLLSMPEFDLVAVADRSADASYVSRYGARVYRDGLELLQRETLDAVSICTSPKHREPLIAFAAANGVALFIEKPFAGTLADAKRLEALCAQHHALVMVGFSFRFHPAIVKLRELMAGPLGQGWLLCGEYVFDWLPAADFWLWDDANGGGFFNENSCHLFDAVCYLLGEPVSVTAEGITVRGSPSEEAAAIALRFESGAVASLMVGGLGAGAFNAFPRLNLITDKGQAQLGGHDHTWSSLTWATREGADRHMLEASPETLGQTRYTHALRHFAACVKSGKRPSATVQDGVRAVALAEAVYTSIRSGQKVTVQR